MAQAKPLKTSEEDRYERILNDAITDSSFSYTSNDFSQPDKGDITDILKQRQGQRKWLFWFAICFSSLSFVGLFVMLFAQAIYKATNQGAALFGDLELGTVAVGVFVQFLGLLKIITDSLWNDKPYLDSGVLNSKKDS